MSPSTHFNHAAADQEARRRQAEQQIRERYQRQQEDLRKLQERQRLHDTRMQAMTTRQIAVEIHQIEEKARETREQLDRQWEQEQRRLRERPASNLTYHFGPPPKNNRAQEYEKAKTAYDTKRQDLDRETGRKLTACEAEREALTREYERQNLKRDDWHRAERDNLQAKQDRNFDRDVKREMDRGNNAPRREFSRRSRGPDRGDR